MTARQKYDRQGLLALAPEAFLGTFNEPLTTVEPSGHPDIAAVRISGPLEHHKGPFFDSYDSLLDRIELACATSAKHVLLIIDSPGGQVSGLFETAGLIRDHVKASGKTLTAWVEGSCCSAAYALACTADRIVTSSTGLVGSIGVLDTRIDLSAANEAQGVRVALITSGARKADGHPYVGLSAEELADRQRIVDQLASVFFQHVAESRGLSIEAIQSLEARIFPGQSAVTAGLADEVSTYTDLIMSLVNEQEVKMSALQEARAALEKVAESENEEEATAAKKALAAMDESEEDEDEDEKESAESEEDEEKTEEAKASSASTISASTAGDLAATVQALSSKVEKLASLQESTERKALLASRSDLGKELVKVLETKPLAEVRQIVNAIPKKGSTLAATTVVPVTQGKTQGDDKAPRSEPKLVSALRARMGLTTEQGTGIEFENDRLVLGAPVTITKESK